jgi:drug/metabolite transporter (DMT)-like permease
MHRRASFAVVLLSALFFATLAVLARLAYEQGARPLPLLSWRFALAALAIGSYVALRRPGDLRAGLQHLPRYAALSLTGYGAASVCFFFALQRVSASVVAVLLYTYPAIVALLAVPVLKERLTASRIVALLTTFAGCVLVVGVLEERVSVDGPGIVLALGAGVGYAAFTLLSQKLVAGDSRLVTMAYTFGLSAAGVTMVTLLVGESLSPVGWTGQLWLLLGGIVALPTFAAVALYLRGIRELGAPQAAVLSTVEPVFTVGLAGVVLGERLTVLQLAGVALVVVGIAIAEWPDRTSADVAVPL